MTHDDAFLQAIIESPDDDGLRLIYADYLDERGDPRGEFIRIQIALATLPDNDPQREELGAKERQLLAEHEEIWTGPLRGLVEKCEFQRGFVEGVLVSAQKYLDGVPELARLAPIRRVGVDLRQAAIPPALIEHVPESVARENAVLPIGMRRTTLLLAMARLTDADLLQKLQFILNRDIEVVEAPHEQLVEAIDRYYGMSETESVDTACFLGEAADPEFDAENDQTPVARLVNVVLQEAFALGANEIRIEALADAIGVSYLIGGVWAERDRPPRRLLDGIVSRIRFLASLSSGRVRGTRNGFTFVLEVDIRAANHGPVVVLTFLPR